MWADALKSQQAIDAQVAIWRSEWITRAAELRALLEAWAQRERGRRAA